MLASLATRLTRIGVKLEPSRSNKPLVKAAADTCKGQQQQQQQQQAVHLRTTAG
jgi:hypothetical protein